MSSTYHKPDITTEADVARLIETFYHTVRIDALLSPFFEHIDFEHHMPRMIAFWSLSLLGVEGYRGNLYDKHSSLPISGIHFDRWLEMFIQTVDELYAGEIAEQAKSKAQLLKYTIESKMAHERNDR
jgi:hemoglobin